MRWTIIILLIRGEKCTNALFGKHELKETVRCSFTEENISTVKKHDKKQLLLNDDKQIGLKVTAEETKRMLISYHNNAGQTTT
jgi:hypothetical protein